MKKSNYPSRRDAIKKMGIVGAAAVLPAVSAVMISEGAASENTETSPDIPTSLKNRVAFREELKRRIDTTPLVDSHEHLCDELERFNGPKSWVNLLRHYFSDDFVSAGLDWNSVWGDQAQAEETPVELWRRIEPYWFAVKNTGYGQAVRIAIRELFGINKLEESVISELQKRYEENLTVGLYDRVLKQHANIESCQVDRGPYYESRHPELLLHDINIVGMMTTDSMREISSRVGTTVKTLADCHEAIRLFFKKYAPYATAVKSQIAYSRGLDFEQVPAERAEEPFQKKWDGKPISPEETKLLQDHLFWFCVQQADEHQLPVKLHTGYYVGNNSMPLSRLSQNPAQMTDLCLRSKKTRWVFMHTCYPYSRELIAIAKQFSNAYVQTCWAWIIDPLGTKNFLKQYLVTAPANKIHVFGGDYGTVENVLGHARIARNGVYAALAELVEEDYLEQDDALELVEPLLRGNVRRIFDLEKKYEAVKHVPWK